MRSPRPRHPTISAQNLDSWSEESLQDAYFQMAHDYRSEFSRARAKLPSRMVIVSWGKEILIEKYLELQNNYEAALQRQRSWPGTQSRRKRQAAPQSQCKGRKACVSTGSRNATLPASPTRDEPMHLGQSLAELQSIVKDLQGKLAECSRATLANRTTIEDLRVTEASLRKDLNLSLESIREKDSTIAQLKTLIARDVHRDSHRDTAGLRHVTAYTPGSSFACSESTINISQDPVSWFTPSVEEPQCLSMAECIRDDDVQALYQKFDDDVWLPRECSGPGPLAYDFQGAGMSLEDAEAEKCIGADDYLLMDHTVDSERLAVYI